MQASAKVKSLFTLNHAKARLWREGGPPWGPAHISIGDGDRVLCGALTGPLREVEEPAYRDWEDYTCPDCSNGLAEATETKERYMNIDPKQVLPSYPKLWAYGHRATKGLFEPGGYLVMQEKVDGSQISFRWVEDQLYVRSKGRIQWSPEEQDPDGLFRPAIEYLRTLPPGPSQYVYRAETLAKPRHNIAGYSRTPKGHLALFEVWEDGGVTSATWASETTTLPEVVQGWQVHLGDVITEQAEALGIDEAPVLWQGRSDKAALAIAEGLIGTPSFLGGHPIEGVVIKDVGRLNPFGDSLQAKIVDGKFKETHREKWRPTNPTAGDIVAGIIDGLNTEARWHKAIQRAKEEGTFTGDHKDIGPLMKSIKHDTLTEEEENIKEALWRFYKRQIERGVGRGFPEWYKEMLWNEA